MNFFILFVAMGLALAAFLFFDETKHLTLQWILDGLYFISGVIFMLLITSNIIKF